MKMVMKKLVLAAAVMVGGPAAFDLGIARMQYEAEQRDIKERPMSSLSVEESFLDYYAGRYANWRDYRKEDRRRRERSQRSLAARLEKAKPDNIPEIENALTGHMYDEPNDFNRARINAYIDALVKLNARDSIHKFATVRNSWAGTMAAAKLKELDPGLASSVIAAKSRDKYREPVIWEYDRPVREMIDIGDRTALEFFIEQGDAKALSLIAGRNHMAPHVQDYRETLMRIIGSRLLTESGIVNCRINPGDAIRYATALRLLDVEYSESLARGADERCWYEWSNDVTGKGGKMHDFERVLYGGEPVIAEDLRAFNDILGR